MERDTTVVVVTHDPTVGTTLGRAVTIRNSRVGTERRNGQDYAVIAGVGAMQLPPEVVADYPPGTPFLVDQDSTGIVHYQTE